MFVEWGCISFPLILSNNLAFLLFCVGDFLGVEVLARLIFLLPQRDVPHSDEASQCIAQQDA